MNTTSTDTNKASVSALAAMLRGAGYEVEVEHGFAGLVIYGPAAMTVGAAARALARAARMRDPDARIDGEPLRDDDEPPATRWWARVLLDWNRFEDRKDNGA